MMAVARTLLTVNSTHRELFLFDTYSGMPDPGDHDVDVEGRSGAALLSPLRELPPAERVGRNVLAECPVDAVRWNLLSTGYPPDRLHFVEGRVETTVPAKAPDQIALLRLERIGTNQRDTSWFISFRGCHGMEF